MKKKRSSSSRSKPSKLKSSADPNRPYPPAYWGQRTCHVIAAVSVLLAVFLPWIQPWLEGHDSHAHPHSALEKVAGFGVWFPLLAALGIVAGGQLLVVLLGRGVSRDAAPREGPR